jgi:ribosomal protein S18 acetylase RimI-like enzyme
VVYIRPASTADAEAVALVRRETWLAAYDGIIRAEIIDRVTAPYDAARERAMVASRPWRRMLVAETELAGERAAGTGADAGTLPAGTDPAGQVPQIVGYASYGPERDMNGTPSLCPAGAGLPDACIGELYALYVAPAWWSAGIGRALMERVLSEVRGEGYPRITLWVLEENTRARRFYERSGFRVTAEKHIMHGLGGVIEVRYDRDLSPAHGRA